MWGERDRKITIAYFHRQRLEVDFLVFSHAPAESLVDFRCIACQLSFFNSHQAAFSPLALARSPFGKLSDNKDRQTAAQCLTQLRSEPEKAENGNSLPAFYALAAERRSSDRYASGAFRKVFHFNCETQKCGEDNKRHNGTSTTSTAISRLFSCFCFHSLL